MIGGERARWFGFSPNIDGRPRAILVVRQQLVIVDVEMASLEGHTFALRQGLDHGNPFASIAISLIVLRKPYASLLKLRTVPGVYQIDGEATPADVLDLQRHFGEHDGMIEI